MSFYSSELYSIYLETSALTNVVYYLSVDGVIGECSTHSVV